MEDNTYNPSEEAEDTMIANEPRETATEAPEDSLMVQYPQEMEMVYESQAQNTDDTMAANIETLENNMDNIWTES